MGARSSYVYLMGLSHPTSQRSTGRMKDEGFEEVIHTVGAGGPVTASSVKGGLGLVLNDVSRLNPDGSPWSASQWAVKDSDSDSIDVVQVELSCTNGDGSLDITYIVSLYPLSMATAVVVKNKGAESVKLTNAILSHLRFKSRYGSAVEGLRGCSYCAYPPLSSSFGILSPADAMEPEPPSWYSFLGSAFSKDNDKEAKDSWTVEDDWYTILRSKLSRVYTAPPTERLKRIYRTPPSKYITIDQVLFLFSSRIFLFLR
ncbi:putative Photosynthetic NDH subunit of subcomplex B 2, chloroplastic [Cocos nucifera]|uniref:Putative Photosynthetic NDH subunit of subcomplex B 2, chloroplastic n=1 Tax=Cocos nucifera TaxID=13894 RepID=A0A8K0MXN7_COCNU|nr:putative Photosynthetic NDH subunit of subcomplex B 2, chloroplastic [Cocos nucifera]